MQLKANGGMFHYSLVTQISDRLIQFLEVVDEGRSGNYRNYYGFSYDRSCHFIGTNPWDGGQRGKDLLNALIDACYRYFRKISRKKPL